MPDHRKALLTRANGLSVAPAPVKIVITDVKQSDFEHVIREHVDKPYYLKDVSSQESWRQLPEIPSGAEINDDHDDKENAISSTLPSNIVTGPWQTKADYIGAQYQLLRHDAIHPLQESVREYKACPWINDNENTLVYTHVFIVGYIFAQLGAAAHIEFSTERAKKHIRWSQSKRLQQGTIVALSPVSDNFKRICKIAVVAARPLSGVEDDIPQIDIFWATPGEAEFDPTEEYVMIESKSGYFEASRHMLVAMQKLMSENFPLAEHLVELNKTIDPPTYVQQQPKAALNALAEKQVRPSNGEGEGERSDPSPLDEVDILGDWPDIKDSSLDSSQMAALKRILGKKLAIIQGPPGTGKTFVSINALKVMLDNWVPGDPPILVSAQTNHALDQLLNLIEPFEPNFLRIGGRSSEDNEVVQARTLYMIRNLAPPGASGADSGRRVARGLLEKLSDEIIGDIQDMNNQGLDEIVHFRDLQLITQEQADSLNDTSWVDVNAPMLQLQTWLGSQRLPAKRTPPNNEWFEEEEDDLEYEILNEAEIEARKARDEDEDIAALKGPRFFYRREFIGKANKRCSDSKVRRILETTSNFWDVNVEDRGSVYNFLKKEASRAHLIGFRERMAEYLCCANNIKIAKWKSDATLIRKTGIKLIGCTTTGLSKYRGLIASLKPRTLLIEEAAETLEGTILAAMFESLEQLILVGDHLQLQAHCNVVQLEKEPYNLVVSLFERLINNGMEYTMLNTQRRMITELRKLLNPIYPGLRDHDSVLDYNRRPPVPGMGGRNSYFFHHTWNESRDESQSRYNPDEANMIAAFFNYLILNGVEASKITILTFYNGQRKMLLKLLKRIPNLSMRGPFNVFTVDAYQGEENDVIMLSLVRSNVDGNIGFLENRNRAVVALSRARYGMYMFGDCINLLRSKAESYHLWMGVISKMKLQGRFDIDAGLPVVCSTHSRETNMLHAEDFESLSGGCEYKCDGALPCGHACPFTCHPFSHEDLLCKELCRRMLQCHGGHLCKMRCSDICVCPKETPSTFPDLDIPLPLPRRNSVVDDSMSAGAVASPVEASKWKEWNAHASDRKLEDSESNNNSKQALPPIRETYRQVRLSGDDRVVEQPRTVTHDGKAAFPQKVTVPNMPAKLSQPKANNAINGAPAYREIYRQVHLSRDGRVVDQPRAVSYDGIAASLRKATTTSVPVDLSRPKSNSMAEAPAFKEVYRQEHASKDDRVVEQPRAVAYDGNSASLREIAFPSMLDQSQPKTDTAAAGMPTLSPSRTQSPNIAASTATHGMAIRQPTIPRQFPPPSSHETTVLDGIPTDKKTRILGGYVDGQASNVKPSPAAPPFSRPTRSSTLNNPSPSLGAKLYIQNLSPNIIGKDLKSLFGRFGSVLQGDTICDHLTGRSKGFGFVTMASDREAWNAVANLNGACIDGQALQIENAKSSRHRGRRGLGADPTTQVLPQTRVPTPRGMRHSPTLVGRSSGSLTGLGSAVGGKEGSPELDGSSQSGYEGSESSSESNSSTGVVQGNGAMSDAAASNRAMEQDEELIDLSEEPYEKEAGERVIVTELEGLELEKVKIEEKIEEKIEGKTEEKIEEKVEDMEEDLIAFD